ncbi:hypothetical protein [Bacillus sp. JAS24-2]|uniref:hypothetical protein n=1 Tax=Bacillus sp. JAS24-2 TaxID=2217832 RepID=UPI0011ECE117|nr:hypothetical protein [Bacillus sp. JAS24-2]
MLNNQTARIVDVGKRVGVNSHNESIEFPENISSDYFVKECNQKKKLTKSGDVSFLLPLYTAYDVI